MTKNDEPFFIAQTFEPEHVNGAGPLRWWRDQGRKAVSEGATWPRYSWRDDEPRGILIECWKIRPSGEGAPRWMLTP